MDRANGQGISKKSKHLEGLRAYTYVDSILVVGDSGGMSITSMSDEDATELFLEWLDAVRKSEAAELGECIRLRKVEQRRESIRVVAE